MCLMLRRTQEFRIEALAFPCLNKRQYLPLTTLVSPRRRQAAEFEIFRIQPPRPQHLQTLPYRPPNRFNAAQRYIRRVVNLRRVPFSRQGFALGDGETVGEPPDEWIGVHKLFFQFFD